MNEQETRKMIDNELWQDRMNVVGLQKKVEAIVDYLDINFKENPPISCVPKDPTEKGKKNV